MKQIQLDDRVGATFDLPLNLTNPPIARNVVVSAYEGID
jgi:hypothetical protein